MKYEIVEGAFNSTLIKQTLDDGSIWWIPCDETNSHYQAYLRWLENPDAELGGTL